MTILIIDDDPDFAGFLRNYLIRRQLEVVLASNGKQGIEVLRRIQPDLIFLDLNMPGVDGFEVLKFMKSENHTTRVVVTSGYIDEYRQNNATLLSQVEILHKPFKIQRLNEILDRAEAHN